MASRPRGQVASETLYHTPKYLFYSHLASLMLLTIQDIFLGPFHLYVEILIHP
jgi:hypothetical protein